MVVHQVDTCAFVVPHVCLGSGLDNFFNAGNFHCVHLVATNYISL